jgi:hypothetical protein
MFGVAAGALLFLSGCALVIGLFTTASSVGIGVAAICNQVSSMHLPVTKLFQASSTSFLVEVIAIALVLTGPGGWSIDARRLGFRELAIPPRPIDPNLD